MRNTALSAAHMVRNPVSPGGEDMVKVRLQGTKEDMEWLEEQLLQIPNVKITESSEIFSNKGKKILSTLKNGLKFSDISGGCGVAYFMKQWEMLKEKYQK